MGVAMVRAETIVAVATVLLGGTLLLALVSALAGWERVFLWTMRGLFAAGVLGAVFVSVGIWGLEALVIPAWVALSLLIIKLIERKSPGGG